MANIFLISQNLKLESLKKYKEIAQNDFNVVLSTSFLFPNERKIIESILLRVEFRTFADYLKDEDMAFCDEKAYEICNMNYNEYLLMIKKLKNEKVLNNLKNEFQDITGYILCKDLGIDENVWTDNGFKTLKGQYYCKKTLSSFFKRNFHSIYKLFENENQCNHKFENVYVAEYNNKKYIFVGKMDRIKYRLGLDFKKSKYEADLFNKNIYYDKDECQYLTTMHERYKCHVPDDEKYDVRYIQDGFLPSNYTAYDYNFKPNNVEYYAWDAIGEKLFKNKNLPVSIIPFRKKLYLPIPKFPKNIKTVLIAASGSGDWTALKNRSDDDMLVYAFSQLAQRYPDINFVYRCHHTWIHPSHLGVNSINRVKSYFKSTNLKNIRLSSNLPNNNLNNFQLTVSRNSLEEDLNDADIVFGEHSVSMIDAGFKGIPFCSVNMTGRRNFFSEITDLGFPHAENTDEISQVLDSITSENFQESYYRAVKNYNTMTDWSDIYEKV